MWCYAIMKNIISLYVVVHGSWQGKADKKY
jgi:hypothetical protein